MQIGNRQLPYPVFNRSESLNCFQNGRFIFEHTSCERNEETDEFVIHGACANFNSPLLECLLEAGKIGIMMIVECSETVYRKNWELSVVPKDIAFPFSDVHGKVVVSAFAYAKEAMSGYCDDDFLPEYSGISFEIEKNDILAIDDGFSLPANHIEKSDDYVASIVTVSKKLTDDKLMEVQLKTNKIDILLPPEQYDIYDMTKKIPQLKNIYFATLLVPAITSALSQLVAEANGKGYRYFEDFEDEYEWCKSFAAAYKKKIGKELTLEELNTLNALEVAQLILNNPTTTGVKEIYNLAYTNPEENE